MVFDIAISVISIAGFSLLIGYVRGRHLMDPSVYKDYYNT